MSNLNVAIVLGTFNATVPPSLTRLVAVSFHSRKDFKDIFSSQHGQDD